MQVYVRLGIRLLYKASIAPRWHGVVLKLLCDGQGARSRLEGARGSYMVQRYSASPSDSRMLAIARRLLKSLTIKQGIKYDSPESTREISAFIQFHNLKVDEILEPISSFSGLSFFSDCRRALNPKHCRNLQRIFLSVCRVLPTVAVRCPN
jgi:phosphatidylserine decarboxylase